MLEKYVCVLVDKAMLEATARTGPRTGTFELDEKTIEDVRNLAVVYRDAFVQDPTMKPEKKIVIIRDPVTGKPTRIPFVFVNQPKETASGWFIKYDKASGGRIFLNVANANDVESHWFKTVVNHELAHLFDKSTLAGRTPADDSAEAYFKAPRETFAYGHQFITIINDHAKIIANEIKAGKESGVIVANTIVKKPHYILRNAVNRDEKLRNVLGWYIDNEKFMRRMLQACYQAVQNHILPALEEYRTKTQR